MGSNSYLEKTVSDLERRITTVGNALLFSSLVFFGYTIYDSIAQFNKFNHDTQRIENVKVAFSDSSKAFRARHHKLLDEGRRDEALVSLEDFYARMDEMYFDDLRKRLEK